MSRPTTREAIQFVVSFFVVCLVLANPVAVWAQSAGVEVSPGGEGDKGGVESSISISPMTATLLVGSKHTVVATITPPSGEAKALPSLEGIEVTFAVFLGPNAQILAPSVTNASGVATYSYIGTGGVGVDQIYASWINFFGQRDLSPVSLAEWVSNENDCNNNQIPDSTEIAESLAQDCNDNGIPDECDIRDGVSFDCNNDGIPDECRGCPPVDIVFVMDTSGSMGDESDALCASIGAVSAELAAVGITVNPFFWGITDTYFACLEDYVTNQLGSSIPGNTTCGTDIISDEDWGPATAVVAERFPWTPGNVRLIVPISDEGPCRGNSCEDPGTDRDSITNAITIANNNNCFVSTIVGTGANQCVIDLAQALASGTRGASYIFTGTLEDFAEALLTVITQACDQATDCNQNSIPDECDIASGFSQDANQNGVPDECERRGEYRVLDHYGQVFDVGNTSPVIDAGLYPPCGIALATTGDCQGSLVLDESGRLYPYGYVSEGLTGQDYGCKIARDVELTPSAQGAYVLSGYGTIDAYGDAYHFGSTYFGSFMHPIDAARDLELVLGRVMPDKQYPHENHSGVLGYYILNCLGQVLPFGDAHMHGDAFFGFDIARAMELAPDGNGYIILDGYGQVHGFGSMESVAMSLAAQNPYFGCDMARDIEITPSGNGWHILDGHGHIFHVGDAQPLVNDPLVTEVDVFEDLEPCSGGGTIPPNTITSGIDIQVAAILKKLERDNRLVLSPASPVAANPAKGEEPRESLSSPDPEAQSVEAGAEGGTGTPSQSVTLRLDGKAKVLAGEQAQLVPDRLAALVRTSLVSGEKVTMSDWREAKSSDRSIYLRFRSEISLQDSSGQTLSVNAVVIPQEGSLAEQKGLLLSDPKAIGNYVRCTGCDAAALAQLLEAVSK